jgi:two-component system sensor kinase FixL
MNSAVTQSLELQALLNATVDAIILIDDRGRVEVFNHSAERLFGYAAFEVLGQNVSVLMTEKDRRQHDAYLARYQTTRVPRIIGVGREVTARRKDGSTFPAYLSVGEIAGSGTARYVGFIQDQTLQQQALTAVVRERDRANGYLDVAQTMLVALDTQHRVTLINRKGCEILGYEESALLGQDWFKMVVPESDSERVAKRFAEFMAARQHPPLQAELAVRTAGGAERIIAFRTMVIEDSDGNATGVLSSGEDVTEWRQAEAEAREARERMMHVSRLATMGEMAEGISHELNQPLAAITTYAQAASRLLDKSNSANEDISEALQQIAAQALRAGEIIRRLRKLVKNHETQREPGDINELIRELGTLTRSDARLNDVRIRLDLADHLPAVYIDSIQIQQVLLNLVRNAVQALEAVPAWQREIVIITTALSDDAVEVRVCDSGRGVVPEMLDRLFHPFATTKADGTGLGLAISQRIIEAHRGSLYHLPNKPQGACFCFHLPTVKGSTQQRPAS